MKLSRYMQPMFIILLALCKKKLVLSNLLLPLFINYEINTKLSMNRETPDNQTVAFYTAVASWFAAQLFLKYALKD